MCGRDLYLTRLHDFEKIGWTQSSPSDCVVILAQGARNAINEDRRTVADPSYTGRQDWLIRLFLERNENLEKEREREMRRIRCHYSIPMTLICDHDPNRKHYQGNYALYLR